MCGELFPGLHQDPREVLTTGFQEPHREMVILKNIPFYSLCEHHFLPFHGRAHVGYVPEGRIAGASKIARAVDILARRPQLQERLTGQIADAIMEGLSADGVAVVVEAGPLCMTMRGGPEGGAAIHFGGDREICDYMDFVAAAGEEEAVVSAVLRSLGEEPWEELVLWAVPEGSPTLRALQSAAPGFGLRVNIESEDVCPQLELPATWDEYLASLDKKDRHELRRKLRKLSQGGTVILEAIGEPVAA